MSLHPTPTRVRRLEEVERGEIARYGDNHDYDAHGFRLDAAMAGMEREGWVELGEPHPVKTPWKLTPAGAAVLARAREKAKNATA